jgi:hypothetical protein
MLSKNLKIKICKTMILPVGLYALETWCLQLREGHRLKVFQNRVLKGIFKQQRDEVGENCLMRSFITSNLEKSIPVFN